MAKEQVADNPIKKILFLAANPQATSQLSLDEEAKKIRQGLERSKWRDRFEIFTRWAVDPDELRWAARSSKPIPSAPRPPFQALTESGQSHNVFPTGRGGFSR